MSPLPLARCSTHGQKCYVDETRESNPIPLPDLQPLTNCGYSNPQALNASCQEHHSADINIYKLITAFPAYRPHSQLIAKMSKTLLKGKVTC